MSLAVQWLRPHTFSSGKQLPSPVRKLRSLMPCGGTSQKTKKLEFKLVL